MDGTLTPPRKKISRDIIRKLRELSDIMTIGIVTGSDYDYIMQQCDIMFEVGGVPVDRMELFPCNGTKHYTSREDNSYELVHSVNMVDEIGQDNYNYIMQSLIANQLIVSVKHKLPYTGTFFQYRGSMLNWCPVGRQAGDKARKEWVDVDVENGIRAYYLKDLQSMIEKKQINLTVALGGSTSFDIYPTGWDKTYVLKHLEAFKDVYFVGDKCQEGGNDKALYDALTKRNCSYETAGPENTISIIDKIIKRSR